jgi:hypothetical protein
MTFKNNIGTFVLSRIMYSIDHQYTFDGNGPARLSIVINITGNLRTFEIARSDDDENPDNLGSSMQSIYGKGGERGTLVLPNKTYERMKVTNITAQDGIWARWGVISASFTDDKGDGETNCGNVITWCDNQDRRFTLFSPNVIVNTSKIRTSERMIFGISDRYLRQQLGYDLIRMNVSGQVRCPIASAFPDGLMESMEQRSDDEILAARGFPRVASCFGDLVPESVDWFNIKNVMIVDASAEWHFEKDFINVNINLMAPPQFINILDAPPPSGYYKNDADIKPGGV